MNGVRETEALGLAASLWEGPRRPQVRALVSKIILSQTLIALISRDWRIGCQNERGLSQHTTKKSTQTAAPYASRAHHQSNGSTARHFGVYERWTAHTGNGLAGSDYKMSYQNKTT